jgi:hypothetical protein
MALNVAKAKAAGYTDEEISAYQSKQSKPTLNVAGFDTGLEVPEAVNNALSGAGKAFYDAGRGLGIADASDASTRAADEKLLSTGAGMAGNVLGNVALLAPTVAIPGAATVRGAGAIGALTGGALTEGDLATRAKAALAGGIGGAAGQKVAGALSRIVSPKVSPDVEMLLKENVSLTPGQIMGGRWKTLEEKARSIPLAGDMIANAQLRGGETLNKASLNRALNPLGQDVTDIGREGLAQVRQALGQAYDDLLPKMSTNLDDPEFIAKLSNLRSMAKSLPSEEARQFDNILVRELESRMAPNFQLSGQNLKDAQSGLSSVAKDFSTSSNTYQRQLGSALKQADAELRDLIKRANPQNAEELKAIDKAYANFKVAQRAASSVASDGGIPTPAQLLSAVKNSDKSKDKRAFSEGTALMQDLAEPAKKVMGNKYPDSGTAGRLAAGGALLNARDLFTQPATLAGTLATLGAYSRPGTKALEYALARRPEQAKTIGEFIRMLQAPAGATGSAIALSQ